MNKRTVKNGLKIALVTGGIFALVPAVYGQGIGLQTLERMTAGTPQQLERGEQVYEDQCATCHGSEGLGDAELGQQLGAQGFVDTDVERSGLESIFSVISHGYEYNDQRHPVFENLFYQDRWAVSHYVHDLIDDPQPSPEEVVERVIREAREGVCDPDIRAGITEFAEPEDDEQITFGEQLYTDRGCQVCHGDEGRGDGPGAGTDPPARDFHDPPEEWTNGTSPLALFNTLDQGIEGTVMPAFGHFPDDELWAMTHFIREEFVPAENREELTEEQIDEVCRSLSAPPRPDPIPIDRAMEFLVDDADEQRFLQLRGFGDPIVHAGADLDEGEELYMRSCASCHGVDGEATRSVGPYGTFPPYLQFTAQSLVPSTVGGTYVEVSQRVMRGPHAALPDMSSTASFSESDWRDIQAYISGFDGEGQDRVRTVNFDDLSQEQLAELDRDEAIRVIETLDDQDEIDRLMQTLGGEDEEVFDEDQEFDEYGEPIEEQQLDEDGEPIEDAEPEDVQEPGLEDETDEAPAEESEEVEETQE